MGCWHGCGHRYGPPYGIAWGEPVEWYDPVMRPPRRRRRFDPEEVADELEARLEALHDEVRRVESELVSLRRTRESPAGGPPSGG
jgi:hypothetical protein